MKPATAGTFDQTLPPEAGLPAVCVAVIDMGTHTKEDMDRSKPPRDHPMVAFVWELHWRNEDGEEETALVVRDYTSYYSENSNLRKIAKACLGKSAPDGSSFPPEKLLGTSCTITISHKKSGDRTYYNIAGIGALTFGAAPPKPTRAPVVVELTDLVPDWVPWIYGETVGTRRSRCHELQGQSRAGEISEDGEIPGDASESATITGEEQRRLTELFKRKGKDLAEWIDKAGFGDISRVTLPAYEKAEAALSKLPDKADDIPF